MRWFLGILMLGLVGVQSAVILRQHATLSSATVQFVEREAAVRALQQRTAELETAREETAAADQVAERGGRQQQSELALERDELARRLLRLEQDLTASHAERTRDAAALVLAEMELAEQREVAGKLEQDLSMVRAELLWKKVGGAAARAVDNCDTGRTREQKQAQQQSPTVVTAHSAIAAETPTARAGSVDTARGGSGDTARAAPRDTASQIDGAARGGEKAESVATNASASAPNASAPKKIVRREARRIRRDDPPAGEAWFSFLP